MLSAMSRASTFRSVMLLRPATLFKSVPCSLFSTNISVRLYTASAGRERHEIQTRVFEVLKNFDKISETSKIQERSHFSKDLGLDSLDTVEVVMAIEEEFSIEIPDKDADGIHSVKDAVDYISSHSHDL